MKHRYSTLPNKRSYLNNHSYWKFPPKILSVATRISIATWIFFLQRFKKCNFLHNSLITIISYTIYKLHQNHSTITNIGQILSKAIKSHSYFEIFQNLISVATLIRAYLDEKIREINSCSYMFIGKCRVQFYAKRSNHDHKIVNWLFSHTFAHYDCKWLKVLGQCGQLAHSHNNEGRWGKFWWLVGFFST